MSNVKEKMTEVIRSQPEDATYEEIMRELTFGKMIERGLADSRSGRVIFLLVEGTFSRWHRVCSDEAWHHYEGSSLDLFSAPPRGGKVRRRTLGSITPSAAPLHVVPAGWWQAACPLGPYALVGCSLGPAFEYDDFLLLSDLAEHARPEFDPPDLLPAFL